MTEFYQLGQYLKEKRVSADLTQAELADSLNVHCQFVSNWERGLCAPPGHSFHKLIDCLNLSKEKLVQVMLSDSKKIIESKVYKAKGKKRA